MMQQYANPYSAPLATPLSFLHQLIQQNAPALQSNIMNPASNLMSVPDPTTLDVNLAFDPTQPSLSPVDNTTSLQLINGNSLNQYVLPPNSTIEILLINTDGNTHPIHLHGYAFWIVETSDYTPTNPTTPGTYPNWILRDVRYFSHVIIHVCY
jgi:FtsP/CotA-like multicopper oxidase with cupredoxin domain